MFRFPLGCRPTTGTNTPKYKGAFSFREVGERDLAPPLGKACLVSEVQPCKAFKSFRRIPSRQVRVALGLYASPSLFLALTLTLTLTLTPNPNPITLTLSLSLRLTLTLTLTL